MATDADAFQTARRLTREEGIFVGGSGGLNVWCALEVARRVDHPEALVVTILCDTGERYLSKLYDDAWMHDNEMLDAERRDRRFERRPEGVPPIVSVGPAASLRQALNLLSTWGVSQLPVLDGDDCVGSVGDALMARVLEDSALLDRPVSEVMAGPAGGGHQDAHVPAGDHALQGDSRGPHPGGRTTRRHREPLRRPAAGGRDRLSPQLESDAGHGRTPAGESCRSSSFMAGLKRP